LCTACPEQIAEISHTTRLIRLNLEKRNERGNFIEAADLLLWQNHVYEEFPDK
jgi:hypothetical protein